MTRRLGGAIQSLVAVLLLCAGLTAQGIEVKQDGVVLSGSPANCTQPATIRYDDARRVTPEWKTIRREGVRKGSARYSLLISEMNKRIKRLCREIGGDLGKDCIVREGDVDNDNGLTVADVTDDLVQAIESDTGPTA
ncbi:MAG: hypothetical protein AAF196_04120 [Planctomycetota bacterium]